MNSAMGDLRNKINKIESMAREKAAGDAWLRRHGIDPNPPRQPPVVYRCEICGRSHYEVTVYAVKTDMRRLSSPTLLFCEDHLPDWDGPGWRRAHEPFRSAVTEPVRRTL